MNNYNFEDFTETGYCSALELGRRRNKASTMVQAWSKSDSEASVASCA